MGSASTIQISICARVGSLVIPPDPLAKVGVALSSLKTKPLHALRHQEPRGASGCYIWGVVPPASRLNLANALDSQRHLPLGMRGTRRAKQDVCPTDSVWRGGVHNARLENRNDCTTTVCMAKTTSAVTARGGAVPRKRQQIGHRARGHHARAIVSATR